MGTERRELDHCWIIARFGGVRPLAEALGHTHPTTVQAWKRRKVIPVRQIPAVIAAAKALGLALRPKHFFGPEPRPAAERKPRISRGSAMEEIPLPDNPELRRAQFNAIAKIIGEVAGAAGLTPLMLTGNQRSREVVHARQLAYWRAARETGATLAVIGRAFGDRDHTTVLHGIRRHEERLARARRLGR